MNRNSYLKEDLRAEIKQKRACLTGEQVRRDSARIIARLETVPGFAQAKSVHCYVAWQNEVRTHELIQELLLRGTRVVVPAVDLANHTLVHSEISSFSDLRPGAFGILEPAPDARRPVNVGDIDVVIVPAIAVDMSGHRIGYGGGYYDTFLAHIGALKVALVYHFQIVDKIPTRNEDERVDMIVTERGVYECEMEEDGRQR
ncbi:MAG: 5-formyltetrahydrofolate cyclo-ligase [bacterium]